MNLDMEVKNFGPIKRASLSLRPLTIFIGPSDTGKSYAAMLAHSIITSARGRAKRHLEASDADGRMGAPNSMHKSMLSVLSSLKPGATRKCPPALVAQIVKSCRQRLAGNLENEIELNFATSLQSLARNGTPYFSVNLKAGGTSILKYGPSGMTLGPLPDLDIALSATEVPRSSHLEAEYVGGNKISCKVSPALASLKAGAVVARQLCAMIEEKIMPRMIPCLPTSDFYFPAARTGILQAHRAISSSIVDDASLGDVPVTQIPRLSGVVSDFVSAMSNIRPLRGPFLKLGEKIESDMLGGRIGLAYSNRHALPELLYKNHGVDMPIHRASSTVSELAPIILYLKHGIREGGMLAIEEPEAHLHPHNQLQLAGHLTRLVRGGINVMITTHSATLLEAISQYLEVSPMSPKDRKSAVGAENLYLCVEDLAPHLFTPDGNDGCVARKIDMSAEDGISQDEFVEVDKVLNDTNMRIEEYLH